MNSNTCNFDVYVRQHAAEVPSAKNLAYDVIMKLVQPLQPLQGYHLYFDNFYTYITLVKDLFQLYQSQPLEPLQKVQEDSWFNEKREREG